MIHEPDPQQITAEHDQRCQTLLTEAHFLVQSHNEFIHSTALDISACDTQFVA
jgi:hypothetical protein